MTKLSDTQHVALALVAIVALGAGAWFWGVPAAADGAARLVPVRVEAALGEAVARQLAPERVEGPRKTVARVVAALAAAHPSGYAFRVAIARDPAVNAFAAPGGSIVVNQGLLRRTRRAEELAGVLAHELQHVYHRHVTRGMARAAAGSLLIGAIAGDGGLGALLGMAGRLDALRLGREAEAEADRDGLALMAAAGVDPAGMIAAYAMLGAAGGFEPPALLADHPPIAARLQALRDQAAALPRRTYPPLLPDVDWRAVAR